MITYTRQNRGTCSRSTTVTLDDQGVIQSVQVPGGCNGNLKGIMSLLQGMDAREAIRRMEGLTCGPKSTSCPDQIARAIREALDKQTEG